MTPQFKNSKVLCIGEVLWDRLPGGRRPGGALLNIAQYLNKKNIPVTLVSKVGTDSKGISLLGHMKAAGLNTDAIYLDDKLPTSEVGISVDRHHKLRYKIVDPVAWDNLRINMKIVDYAGQAGAIVYSSLASRSKVSRETIEVLLNFDAVKIMNVNLRPPDDKREIVEPLLMKADIVKLNKTELIRILSWHNKVFNDEKDQLQWFLEHYNCNTLCMIRENNGALVYHKGILFSHPAQNMKITNNIGAGATFLAGFIESLISKRSIKNSLINACNASKALDCSNDLMRKSRSENKKRNNSNLFKLKSL